jgi:hypothetical protein
MSKIRYVIKNQGEDEYSEVILFSEYASKLKAMAWGNDFGGNMFMLTVAFTDDPDDLLKEIKHIDIINHWKQVLKKVEEEGVKNDE